MKKTQHGNASDIFSECHLRNRFRYVISDLAGATGTLLNIGAGDGTFERFLREANTSIHITSLDLQEEFRGQLERTSDRVIIADILTYTFTETFDYIVAFDVIEHMWDTDTLVRQIHDALSQHGSAYIKAPNLASWHGRLSLLFGYAPEAVEVSYEKSKFGRCWPFRHEEPIHHVRAFTTGALKEMVEYYGFDVIWAIGVDDRLPMLFKHLPGIAGSVCLKLGRRQVPL